MESVLEEPEGRCACSGVVVFGRQETAGGDANLLDSVSQKPVANSKV